MVSQPELRANVRAVLTFAQGMNSDPDVKILALLTAAMGMMREHYGDEEAKANLRKFVASFGVND